MFCSLSVVPITLSLIIYLCDLTVTGNEGPHPQNLNDGQLPNVNPDAVVVRQPALQGQNFRKIL